MKTSQKQTIYDIARETGTSPSTVSAALNGRWKERRISKETAGRIIELARRMDYSVNRQARGLRTARSGLVGLILPEHDNRFFSDLSQSFTLEARGRSQCPVIIATQRDPAAEESTVQDLMAYSIDALFIAGAADPLRISRICRSANLPHVFIDQPCPDAPSVITDNEAGARALTEAILDSMPTGATPARDRVVLIGGDARLHASASRIEGFRKAVVAHTGRCDPEQIIACGYEPDRALDEMHSLYRRMGGLPAGLFANSINVFEALLRFFAHLPEAELLSTSIGCFDFEPYGELLRFPVHMIRQRHRKLVSRAWELMEEGTEGPVLVTVNPELRRARDGAARVAGSA
ncbi:MAG: LacI family DNA-binding transcriptional regulator [Geminicoccaceae bacterium]